MRSEPSIIPALVALGCSVQEGGELHAPTDCSVRFLPVRDRIQIRLVFGNGTTAVCDVPKSAIKLCREAQ